jgi:hypothetical protein
MKSVTSRRAEGSRSDCRLDILDQLMLLLAGVVILMVNLGLLPVALIAYWPLLLIVFVLKEMLRSN